MINTSKKCNLQSLFILLTPENAQKFSELILQKNVTNKNFPVINYINKTIRMKQKKLTRKNLMIQNLQNKNLKNFKMSWNPHSLSEKPK